MKQGAVPLPGPEIHALRVNDMVTDKGDAKGVGYTTGNAAYLQCPIAAEWRSPMKCPLCNVDLVMSERQGIEIDYCPQCRGVWLDRGELDKIIERSTPSAATTARDYDDRPDREYRPRDYDYDRDRHRDDYKSDYKKKKKKKPTSFLEDLFEFGD